MCVGVGVRRTNRERDRECKIADSSISCRRFNWPSVNIALAVTGHLGVQTGWPWPGWEETVQQRVSQTIDGKGR